MFAKNRPKANRLYKEFALAEIEKEKNIIHENTIKGLVLGSPAFFENIIDKFVDDKKDDSEIHILRDIKSRKEPTLEHIKSTVEKNIPFKVREQRRFSLYLSRRFTQKSLKQIAQFYGKITDAGVSQAARRLEKERGKNKSVNKRLKDLENKIFLSKVET
jgi:hypothetical protein